MPEQSLSPKDIAQLAYNAGFRGQSLTIAVAVAMAESGGNPVALGDVGLETGTWGPSAGLWQVRSLKSQNMSGGVRDQAANMNPSTNASHAASIAGVDSNGQAKSFGAWSTYTNGAYTKFLNVAQQAASGIDSTASVATGGSASGDGSSGGPDLHDVGTQLGFFRDMISNGTVNTLPVQSPAPSGGMPNG